MASRKIPSGFNNMENFDVNAAMAQIDLGVCVKIPRLSKEQIECFSRPQKRKAKKRYHILSFDILDEDEDEFFEMTANTQEFVSAPKKRRRRKRSSGNEICEISQPKSSPVPAVSNADAVTTVIAESKSVPSPASVIVKRVTAEVSDDALACKAVTKSLNPTGDVSNDNGKPNIATIQSAELENNVKKPDAPVIQNSKIGKIRVKTARELGSLVIFLDDDTPTTTPTLPPPKFIARPSVNVNVNPPNVKVNVNPPNVKVNVNPPNVNVNVNPPNVKRPNSSNAQVRPPNMNIQLIADLYAKFFTPKNQVKIRAVAEVLQNITDNIRANTERLHEINNNNKLTDAEKLMHRYNSYQELKRNQEASERNLRDRFQLVMNLFDDENFETLFQLFFLGVLKTLIVNVSNSHKKGTLFKKLLNSLCQSLTNSNYKNDRVFKILKSKDFRDKCIAIVQFIETYSRTELFGMLFLSDADKKMIKSKSVSERCDDEKKNPSSKADYQKDSLLLDLLSKESSKATVIESLSNSQATASKKTYGPASKINSTSCSLPTTSGLESNTNVNFKKNNSSNVYSNQYVNNLIFNNGDRFSNESNKSNVNVSQPTDVRRFVNQPYQSNSFTGFANPLSGITPNVTVRNNSNELSSLISYKNNENIQPGSYSNTNKYTPENSKKISADQNYANGQPNANGFRSSLSNNAHVNNYSTVAPRYLEQHSRSNFDPNMSKALSTCVPLNGTGNLWKTPF